MRSSALSRRLIGISAACPGGLHVHDEGRTCLPLRSEASGSGPTKDTVDVDCRLPVLALVVHPIGHESALSTTTRHLFSDFPSREYSFPIEGRHLGPRDPK